MSGRGVRAYLWVVAGLCLAGGAMGALCSHAEADTLEWALVQAYQNNPSLNSQRAALRVIDENVPQALSGYRPKLSLTGNADIITPTRRSCSRSTALPRRFTSAKHFIRAPSGPLRARRSLTVFRTPTRPAKQ